MLKALISSGFLNDMIKKDAILVVNKSDLAERQNWIQKYLKLRSRIDIIKRKFESR